MKKARFPDCYEKNQILRANLLYYEKKILIYEKKIQVYGKKLQFYEKKLLIYEKNNPTKKALGQICAKG
jgi:hypothetical protein